MQLLLVAGVYTEKQWPASTLEDAQAWLAVSAAASQSQSYEIDTGNGRRKLTRADAAEIRQMVVFWQNQVTTLTPAADGTLPMSTRRLDLEGLLRVREAYSLNVIAKSTCGEAIQLSLSSHRKLDCFASLAMTNSCRRSRLTTPPANHDQHRGDQFQSNAAVERQRITPRGIAQQADHAGPKCVSHLVDCRDQADQDTERAWVEFALHDQRRQ
ncbi:MAG: hypothetical protein JWR80_29, partial [Bradyrhizobium sp.]|nr:hypothetical protein [Bradyrhizobium sp.]